MTGIRIKLNGFQAGKRKWEINAQQFEQKGSVALAAFGQEAVGWLKDQAYAGAFGPPKRWGSGPPLIKTGVYINSIQPDTRGLEMEIKPNGSNRHMSNEALGALLEHGWPGSPARPHWRFLGLWIEKNGAARVGAILSRELFQ